jgi:rhamnosyltransferase
MTHQFGAGSLPVMKHVGKRIPLRPPERFYYIFRNALLLSRLDHCPLGWKLHEVHRLVLLFGAYLLFSPQRLTFLGRACAGLFDGLRGREGPASRALQQGG